MKIKVVFDTNVLISFFIGGKLLDLTYLSLPLHEYTSFFRMICTEITTTEIFSECRDPKDNFLFDIAEQGNACYIVSGDNDVLSVNNPKFRTITLGDFLNIVENIN